MFPPTQKRNSEPIVAFLGRGRGNELHGPLFSRRSANPPSANGWRGDSRARRSADLSHYNGRQCLESGSERHPAPVDAVRFLHRYLVHWRAMLVMHSIQAAWSQSIIRSSHWVDLSRRSQGCHGTHSYLRSRTLNCTSIDKAYPHLANMDGAN